jgi:hypothetical protein
MGVAAYIIHYGAVNGDYMPDRDKTILPHIDIKTWHGEYEADMKEAGASFVACQAPP